MSYGIYGAFSGKAFCTSHFYLLPIARTISIHAFHGLAQSTYPTLPSHGGELVPFLPSLARAS